MIEVKVPDLKEVERRLGKFKSQAPAVLARAINRAAANAKTNMSRKTREKYLIKLKDLASSDNKGEIKVDKASRSKLGAVVGSTGHKIPMIKFKINPQKAPANKRPKEYKGQVLKGGSLKAILGAFVANVDGDYRVLKRKGIERYPLKQLFGPSVPEMIGSKTVMEYVAKEAQTTLNKRLDHEINRVLEAKSK